MCVVNKKNKNAIKWKFYNLFLISTEFNKKERERE